MLTNIPLIVMAFVLMMATIACLLMWRKGHYYVIAPLALPFGWMSFAYVLRDTGAIGHDDFVFMINLGIFVLCMNIIIGAAVYVYTRIRP